MTVTIREAIPEDADEIVSTAVKLFKTKATSLKSMRSALRQNSKFTVLVAEESGPGFSSRMVGHLAIKNLKGKCQLLVIAVEPDHQKKGVGSLLVDHLKSILKDNLSLLIETQASVTSLGTQIFLRSQGFRCTGETDSEVEGDPPYYKFEYQVPLDNLSDSHLAAIARRVKREKAGEE